MKRFRTWITIGLAVTMPGCSPSMSDYKKTIRVGIESVPHVQEITQMFPNAPADHFITHYGFVKNDPVTWNTVVYIHGRYQFGYQVDVVVDYKNNRIVKSVGVKHFYLWEVETLTSPISDDVIEATYNKTNYVPLIGEKQWNQIVAAKGDFSVIGVHLITNAPIPRFDDYVHAWRKDRIQVEFH